MRRSFEIRLGKGKFCIYFFGGRDQSLIRDLLTKKEDRCLPYLKKSRLNFTPSNWERGEGGGSSNAGSRKEVGMGPNIFTPLWRIA